MFPLWTEYKKCPRRQEICISKAQWVVKTKLAMWKWKGAHEHRWMAAPPELIIVYYLAGADVNIHNAGHSLLFKYVGICPANGFCGIYCVRGVSEIEGISPSGTWLQHRSARTSRWHKGSTQKSKLGGSKFEGVSSKSVRRPKARPRTFRFDLSAFIYLPD